mgnify:FL=1
MKCTCFAAVALARDVDGGGGASSLPALRAGSVIARTGDVAQGTRPPSLSQRTRGARRSVRRRRVGVVEAGRIARISKRLADFNAIDCGLFACTPAIFAAISSVIGDCFLSDGMAVLGRHGAFRAFDIGDRWWQDVDTTEMRNEALRVLASLPRGHA